MLSHLGNNCKLTELSIDGNPVSSTVKLKYHLILSVPNLETIDDERVEDLDREVAAQYFEMNELPIPKPPSKESLPVQSGAKRVSKKGDIDDDHEGDWQT